MLTHLAVAALTLWPVNGPAYSITYFSKDCRLSGGSPRVYARTVVCEDSAGRDIHCLRTGQTVTGCTFGSAAASGQFE